MKIRAAGSGQSSLNKVFYSTFSGGLRRSNGGLSDKVEVLATNRLNDHIDASPAAVGRQLFLRGHKYLYCIEQP